MFLVPVTGALIITSSDGVSAGRCQVTFSVTVVGAGAGKPFAAHVK